MPINKSPAIQKTEEGGCKTQQVLDIPADNVLNHLVKLSCLLLEIPITTVSINAPEGILIKAQYGLGNRSTFPNESGLFDDTTFTIIENTTADPRSKNHSLVRGSFSLRFYAAIPLRTNDGCHIGHFCIMDVRPRQLKEKERKIMLALSDIITLQIEDKISSINFAKQQRKTLSTLTHNLKNPLTLITLQSALIMDEKDDHDAIDEMCRSIKKTAVKMTGIIDRLNFEDQK